MLLIYQYLAGIARNTCPFLIFLAAVSVGHVHADSFRVGMPEDFKPYTYTENGVWHGIDVDIGRHFYRALGINPTYLPMPWARQLRLAESGALDAILTVYCDEAAPFLHISKVFLYPVQVSLFGRVDLSEAMSVAGTPKQGAIVGVVRENKLIDLLEGRDQLRIHETYSTPLLLEQLVADRIDYVLEEDLPFLSYARDRGYQSAIKEVQTLKEMEVCLAFSKNSRHKFDEAFLERAENILRQMKANGTIERIVARYTK